MAPPQVLNPKIFARKELELTPIALSFLHNMSTLTLAKADLRSKDAITECSDISILLIH